MDIFLQTSITTLLAFNLVMLATILSRAYLIAEGKVPTLESANVSQFSGETLAKPTSGASAEIWSAAIKTLWAVKWAAIISILIITAAINTLKSTGYQDYAFCTLPLALLPLAFTSHIRSLTNNIGISPLTPSAPRLIWFPYAWRGLMFFLVGSMAAFAIGYALKNSLNTSTLIFITLITYTLVESLLFSKFGTVLSACIVNDDRTIKAASERGVSTFRFAFVKFWIFNSLALLAAFLIASLIYMIILLVSNLIFTHPNQELLKTMLFVLMLMPAVANTVMWAVISARVYVIAEKRMRRLP